MNEIDWLKQWPKNIQSLRKRVNDKNQILKRSNPGKCIIHGFIDAIDVTSIKDIAAKHDEVYLITEQSLSSICDNVIIFRAPDSFYGLYLYQAPDMDVPITKDYNCFINRNDPIRQSWFYFLYDRKLLDRGFVSFNNSMRAGLKYPVDTPDEYFDWIHKTYLNAFDPIRSKIKQLVPFRNFQDVDDLSQIILSSKFSIVLETYFERPDCKTFSEKIFRALQIPRPWLLFAATGCVQKLRHLGFDVFDDYVDHDSYDHYDTSKNCVERQAAILQQCNDLLELKVTEKVLEDWNKRTNYNRSLMEDWNSKYIKEFDLLLDQVFDTARM